MLGNSVHRIGKIIPKKLKDKLNYVYSSICELTEKKRLVKSYSLFIKPGDLAFDIGANVGDHSQILADLGARVVAVEPNPALIEGLKKRFGENAIAIANPRSTRTSGKVKIENVGIGGRRTQLNFKIYNDTGHSTFLENSPKVKDFFLTKTIPVKVITLKDLIKKYGVPKLMKIDVEGFEYEVLKTLDKQPSAIIFEFTSSIFGIAEKCIKHLDKIGNARYNFSLNISHKFQLPQFVDSKTLLAEIGKIPKNCSFGDIYVRFINV